MVWLLGSPEPGPVASAWLGLLLYAGCVAAWGVLASTLVGHQILAYFTAFAVCMVLFLVGSLERYLPAPFGEICRQLSFLTHFEKFSRGVVDSRDVVFFLAMTVVPLTGAAAVLAGRRQTTGRRLGQVAPVVLAAAAATVVFLVALKFPASADLTGNKRYTLAPQTLKVLDALPADLDSLRAAAGPDAGDLDQVMVTAFYQRLDPARETTEALLKACGDRTRAFRYRVVDPEEELELVRQLQGQGGADHRGGGGRKVDERPAARRERPDQRRLPGGLGPPHPGAGAAGPRRAAHRQRRPGRLLQLRSAPVRAGLRPGEPVPGCVRPRARVGGRGGHRRAAHRALGGGTAGPGGLPGPGRRGAGPVRSADPAALARLAACAGAWT